MIRVVSGVASSGRSIVEEMPLTHKIIAAGGILGGAVFGFSMLDGPTNNTLFDAARIEDEIEFLNTCAPVYQTVANEAFGAQADSSTDQVVVDYTAVHPDCRNKAAMVFLNSLSGESPVNGFAFTREPVGEDPAAPVRITQITRLQTIPLISAADMVDKANSMDTINDIKRIAGRVISTVVGSAIGLGVAGGLNALDSGIRGSRLGRRRLMIED